MFQKFLPEVTREGKSDGRHEPEGEDGHCKVEQPRAAIP